MTNSQQLGWATVDHYLALMKADSGSSIEHIENTLKSMRESNSFSRKQLHIITSIMRSCYNLGKGKSIL